MGEALGLMVGCDHAGCTELVGSERKLVCRSQERQPRTNGSEPRSESPPLIPLSQSTRLTFPLFTSQTTLQIFKLSEPDFQALSAVHSEPGKLMYSCDYGSGDIVAADEIFGWSLSEMGWEKLD